MKKYKHLKEKEREQIYLLLETGMKQYKIAEYLGKDPGTISREIDRNSVLLELRIRNYRKKEKFKEYLPDRAQNKYRKRRKESKTPFPLKTAKLYDYVTSELRAGESPDSIAGKAKKDKIGQISHECIYQFIYSKKGRELGLYEYLRRHRKKRKKHKGRKEKRYLIPNRVCISKRPKAVDAKKTFGHWEGDSIIGHKGKSALHTVIERKSRYVKIRKITRKTADATKKAMIDIFKSLPPNLRKTVTLDNGCEFTKHETVTEKTKIKIFFAHPYHSWERGANEHVNGMIRWFLPKGTSFDHLTDQQIQAIEYTINSRPRKILNYQSPYEVFHKQLFKYSHHKSK